MKRVGSACAEGVDVDLGYEDGKYDVRPTILIGGEAGEDDDDEEGYPSSSGTLISWSTSDQLGAVGITYVILALILVSGRVMSDGEHVSTPSLPARLYSRRDPMTQSISDHS